MDWIINKIKLKLYDKYSVDKGYKITEYIWGIFALILTISVGYFTNNLIFALIFFIVTNLIKMYSGSYHCGSLNHCTLFTSLFIIIFGYITKSSLDYIWLIFIITLFCCKDIILKSPVSETDYTHFKTIEYHKKKLTYIIFWLLFSMMVFLELKWNLMANSILTSIIMVDVLLFKNTFSETGDD